MHVYDFDLYKIIARILFEGEKWKLEKNANEFPDLSVFGSNGNEYYF